MATTHKTSTPPTWVTWTFRITTSLLVLWMLSSGVMALFKTAPIVEAISRLGYPDYFVWLLGISKIAEASLLVLRAPSGLRTWAYAGATFEVLAATFSYAASGAAVGEVVVPLVFLVLIQTSYWSWRAQLSHAPTSPPTQPSAFDPNKVQDKGFVKVYRALRVSLENLRPLKSELASGRINADQDLFVVGGPGEQRFAVTLWNLAYHHLAQGELESDAPLLITFCPVCNSGMVFDPRVNGRRLTFRVGGVYRGTMIMCDTQTGSFWDHMTGSCLGGAYMGEQLAIVDSHEIRSAAAAVEADPELRVAVPRLSLFERLMTRFQNGHTWRALPEGKFYPGFRASFVFDDSRRPEKELGLGLWLDDTAKFYPLSELESLERLTDSLATASVELTYDSGTGVPRARRIDGGPPVNFVFTRWYGFAQTFPGCEVFGAEGTASESIAR